MTEEELDELLCDLTESERAKFKAELLSRELKDAYSEGFSRGRSWVPAHGVPVGPWADRDCPRSQRINAEWLRGWHAGQNSAERKP